MKRPTQANRRTSARTLSPFGRRLRGGFPARRDEHRMRGARVIGCAVVVVCSCAATLALGVSSASAYERINEACILRAFAPSGAGSGKFVYGGAVDCSGYGNVWTSLEVCAEVQNTTTGTWYQIKNSCVADGPIYRALNELGSVHEGALCGVNYRTWDYGVAWHGGSHGRHR